MAGPGGGTPQQPANVYQQSAGAYQGALGGTAAAMGGPNIAAFQNPYTQQVVGTSLGALNRARQMGINDIGAQARQAGAFGGSRHGVAEAETNRAFMDQAGQMASNLNMQGFNTALGAAQNQQNTMLQGAGQLGNLANLGFGFGQQIGQTQGAQGAQQQALQQALIDAAKAQYGGYTSSPQMSLSGPLAAVGGIPGGGGQTQKTTQSPGLFNIFGALLGL